MNKTKNPYPDVNIKTRVSAHINSLKKAGQLVNYENTRKQKILLEKFFSLDKRVDLHLREAEKKFSILNGQEAKKELFKMFYWNNLRGAGRIGRYFFLFVFDVDDEKTRKSSFYKGPLVLCWDICTTKIFFMFLFDVGDSGGSGFLLSKGLVTPERKASIKEYGVSEEEVEEHQSQFVFFVDKLISSGILSDEKKLLDILMKNYSEAFIDEKTKGLNFFVRSGQIIELGKPKTAFAHLYPAICGDNSIHRQGLEETNEFLLDEGHPDFQQLMLDENELSDTIAENEGEKPIMRKRNVACVRKLYTNWNDHKFYFSEEPNSYQVFCVMD